MVESCDNHTIFTYHRSQFFFYPIIRMLGRRRAKHFRGFACLMYFFFTHFHSIPQLLYRHWAYSVVSTMVSLLGPDASVANLV